MGNSLSPKKPIHLNEKYRVVLVLPLVCGAIFYYDYARDARHASEKADAIRRIKASHNFAAGTVTDFVQPHRTSLFRGHYTFDVMGQLYHGIRDDRRMQDRESEIQGRLFTVIYERDDPDNSAILIFRSDFAEFGLPCDSIRSIDDGH